jgi:hypothetical protein
MERWEANVKRWMDECELSEEIRADVQDLILDGKDDYTPEEAMRAVMDYEWIKDGRKFHFSDFWEVNNDIYTIRFLWCCYAIVYAIRHYDLIKELKQ